MTDTPAASPSRRTTAHIVAASGRLKNEHFLLTADHLLLEVDQLSMDVVSAMAEGNVEVHMLDGDRDYEYVVCGQSAKYLPKTRRIVLSGWSGTREGGKTHPVTGLTREVVLPTDGSFFGEPEAEAGELSREPRAAQLQAA